MDETVYNLQLKSKTDRGKDIYNFESADGVASKNSFRKSELALADNLNPKLNDDLLIVQTGYGFLPVIMADKAPKGKTLAAETSDRAYQLTKTNLKKNNIQNATAQKTAFYNELEQKFNKIIYAPKSYTPVKIVENRISNLIPLLKTKENFS